MVSVIESDLFKDEDEVLKEAIWGEWESSAWLRKGNFVHGVLEGVERVFILDLTWGEIE